MDRKGYVINSYEMYVDYQFQSQHISLLEMTFTGYIPALVYTFTTLHLQKCDILFLILSVL